MIIAIPIIAWPKVIQRKRPIATLLAQHIRNDIQLCRLLQEPDKRSQQDVRRVILGLVEDQLKDLSTIVKDLTNQHGLQGNKRHAEQERTYWYRCHPLMDRSGDQTTACAAGCGVEAIEDIVMIGRAMPVFLVQRHSPPGMSGGVGPI